MVARDGWRLLNEYTFDVHTGLWRHVDGLGEPPLSLADIQFTADGMAYPEHRRHEDENRLAAYLEDARLILASGHRDSVSTRASLPADLTDDFEHLRWFPMPGELVV